MLQKPTTFSPFVEQFATLALVAGMTGNDQIRRVIAASARQGNNVIDVVPFAYFGMAVVAFAFLSLILCLDILFGVCARGIILTGATLLVSDSALFWVGSIILFAVLSSPFSVSILPVFLPFADAFFVGEAIGFVPGNIPLIILEISLLTMYQIAFLASSCFDTQVKMLLRRWFYLHAISATSVTIGNRRLGRMLSIAIRPALSTIRIQPAGQALVANKKNQCSWLLSFALRAPLVSSLHRLRNRRLSWAHLLTALFAARLKPIGGILVCIKVLFCSREHLVAATTSLVRRIILRYSVHTVRLTFLSSRSGVLAHRRSTTLLPPHYTTNPPVEQVQGVSYG